MGLFDAMTVAATGLTAERLRMDTISANLANANSTRRGDGKPGPYLRREVVLSSGAPGGAAGPSAAFATFGDFSGASEPAGVQISGIVEETQGTGLIHDPSHPDADAQGNVRTPNVNPVTEMTDLITATRAYEANTTSINAIKGEFTRALDVLR
jgi:flagellar basal-body rod protein FlgC